MLAARWRQVLLPERNIGPDSEQKCYETVHSWPVSIAASGLESVLFGNKICKLEVRAMRSKTITLLAMAFGLGVAHAAFAADMPTKAPIVKAPVAAPAPVYNWTGFYIGVNGGYAWGTYTFDYAPPDVGSNNRGGMIGGTLGFNYQFAGPWVLGAEADWDWADINGSASCPNPAFSCETKIRSLGTLRARAGYAMNNVLLYATGGFAWANVNAQTVNLAGLAIPPSGTPTNGSSATVGGWTAGVGLEWAFWQNWSAKIEYLYADFGDHSYNIDNGLVISSRQKENIIRGGFNYRFNLGG